MIAQGESLIAALSRIVGEPYIRQADVGDIVDGVQPQLVVQPATTDEMAQVLEFANECHVSIVPQGGGTKRGWGNPPTSAQLVVSTKRLAQVLEHAAGDMTATVQAGCTVTQFQQTLAQQGQRLAIDPIWPDMATIGGILATNDSGSLRVRFGSLRDMIIGITVVLPDGTIARSGGKVVKNVAGYDLPKLMTGAMGTLGMIADATFRLYPVPRSTAAVTLHPPSAHTTNEILLRILDSTLVPTGLQCLLSQTAEPRMDVRFEGETDALEAQLQQLKRIVAGDAKVGVDDGRWLKPEDMWRDGSATVVCKVSVLPSQLNALATTIQRIAKPLRSAWELLAQAVGVGLLRFDAPNHEALLTAINLLRNEITHIGGSLVVLHCPLDFKARIDVWGSVGSTGPLMRRIRDHFDPGQTLNRGRYLRF